MGLPLWVSEVARYFTRGEKEIRQLKSTLDRINCLLADSDGRWYIEDHAVKLWLCQLRSISFDIENLLDEYNTALEVEKQQNYLNAGSSRKRKLRQIIFPLPINRMRFAEEIRRISMKLDEIKKKTQTPRLGGIYVAKPPHQRARLFNTRLCLDRSTIIGREPEINKIVDLLTSDLRNKTNETIPIVPIHGTAGIGKTTLARLVFDDERINHYFTWKVWVFLTDECDVQNAMSEIYETMTGESCGFQAYDKLQTRLSTFLRARNGDKFLLVIDNLWADNNSFWNNLRIPLLSNGGGIRVLITTRNEKICRIMRALPQPSLKGLKDNECWQIIQSLALPDVTYNIEQHERCMVIGKEIARMCHGSPLAAKTFGAMLSMASEEEWTDVLSGMGDLKIYGMEDLLASLKISYHHLSYHLKQCFSYCSIFPYGHKFERDQVIRYWMAEGLIQPRDTQLSEAVGIKYFEELLWSSFFEKVPACDKSQVEWYQMPRLMSSLARSIGEYEFRGIESEFPLSVPDIYSDQVRYAYLLHRDNKPPVKLESIMKYPNLRTLKVCDEWGKKVVLLDPITSECFLRSVNLRVLDMSNTNLECVPDSIGKLIHLRYLGLSYTEIRTLPEKICDLINLQTLELKGCLKLEVLPEGIRKLINLHHLDLHLGWEEITDSTKVVIPQGIGKLEDLQTLSRFNVASAKGQQCNILELKDLNLRGDLCILNLEKVPTGQAKNANLQGKNFIEKLMLRWHSSAHDDERLRQESEDVIKDIQPHYGLSCLWIVNYPGTKYPDWIGDASFWRLETIRISNCNNFRFLSLLAKLPQLINLQIDNAPGDTMSMLEGFQSMEHLILQYLKSMENITLQNLKALRTITLDTEMPKLKIVSVSRCSVFQEVVLQGDLHNKYERGTLIVDAE